MRASRGFSISVWDNWVEAGVYECECPVGGAVALSGPLCCANSRPEVSSQPDSSWLPNRFMNALCHLDVERRWKLDVGHNPSFLSSRLTRSLSHALSLSLWCALSPAVERFSDTNISHTRWGSVALGAETSLGDLNLSRQANKPHSWCSVDWLTDWLYFVSGRKTTTTTTMGIYKRRRCGENVFTYTPCVHVIAGVTWIPVNKRWR